MVRVLTLFSLLLVLAACAPTAQEFPATQPFVFSTDYETLFAATMQTVTATRLVGPFTRASFAIAEADLDTGLITAARFRRSTISPLGGARFGFSSGSGTSFGVFSPGALGYSRASSNETLLSIVIRPAGRNAASLVFSSTSSDAGEIRIANAFMAEVIQKLLLRFGAAGRQ